MYQLSLNTADPTTIAYTLGIAKEKDIKWIEWHNNNSDELRQLVEDFCREHGVIMTVVDDYSTLKEKKYHGILITQDKEIISALREELGGHPIVGVEISQNDDWKSLRHLDIDYLAIDTDKIDFKDATTLIQAIHSEWSIPIVARGKDIQPQMIDRLNKIGFNGFCFLEVKNLFYL